ncbi:GON domain-containing protein [Archangium gephyra]|uniref:GON domain-containing protein n=1 Tax=Archangium gephyra TaxID=48 RepID=UPI0035D3E3AD
MTIFNPDNSKRRYLSVSLLAGGVLLGACGPSSVAQTQQEEDEVVDEVGIQAMALTANSCANLKAAGQPMGRTYTLFAGGDTRKPFIAWCDTDGDTYLSLPTGSGRNFSQYLQVEGTSVTTTWSKVRLDPVAMTLDMNDIQFATSTGSIPGWNKYYAAYGEAGDCVAPYSSTGKSNVDLRGLPFAVSAAWKTEGYAAAGGATKSANDQVVNATGGGHCGVTSVNGALTVRYVGFPSCAAVAAAGGTLNQDYTLYLNSDLTKPFTAYCHSSGNTYLSLSTAAGSNFSQYLEVEGTSVTTTWSKVRLDPVAMKLDINDTRFATSTGGIPSWNKYYAAFGEAGDCVAPYSSTGKSNVDLRGTPFVVTAAWATTGYDAVGGYTRSFNDQVVNATGGGHCGVTAVTGDMVVRYP